MPDITELPPYDPGAVCPKCGHDQVGTVYHPDTSHYHCPIGKELETGHGPEHLERICRQCGYLFEQATVAPGPVPTTVPDAIALLRQVADARSDYAATHAGNGPGGDIDLALSIDMLRAAAQILESGDVWGWVPSWRWGEFRTAETADA